MKKLKFTLKKAVIYAAILCLTVCIGHVIKKSYLQNSAINNTNPSLEALRSINTDGIEGCANIIQLWELNLLPQRLYAIEQLRKHAYTKDKAIKTKLKNTILQALSSVDSDIKKFAMKFINYKYPDKLNYLLPLLNDTDPHIRYEALLTLTRQGNPDYTNYVVLHLKDTHKECRIIAMTALKRWHNQDFGSCFTAPDDILKNAESKWQKWWLKNQTQFTKNPIEAKQINDNPIKAPDFSLKDFNGKNITLSQYNKPLIMLYFWGKPNHGDIVPMKDIGILNTIFKSQLKILPIAVDLLPKIDEAHQNDPHHHDEQDSKHCGDANNSCSSKSDCIDTVKHNWRKLGFQEQCLIDDGSASFQYISNDLPTIVFISNGIVKKRLTGPRAIDELRFMIKELLE